MERNTGHIRDSRWRRQDALECPLDTGDCQIRQIKAEEHRMSIRSMSRSLGTISLSFLSVFIYGYLLEGLVCFHFDFYF